MKKTLLSLLLGAGLATCLGTSAMAEPYMGRVLEHGRSSSFQKIRHDDGRDGWRGESPRGGHEGPSFHHDARPHWGGGYHVPEWDRWRAGSWTYSHHQGHLGWWWVVDGYWFMYPDRVGPYPDYYAQPVYMVAPQQPTVVVVPSAPVVTVAPAIPANQTSPTYTDQLGRTCRAYQTTVIVGGVSQPASGTACLQPDGAWRVVQ